MDYILYLTSAIIALQHKLVFYDEVIVFQEMTFTLILSCSTVIKTQIKLLIKEYQIIMESSWENPLSQLTNYLLCHRLMIYLWLKWEIYNENFAAKNASYADGNSIRLKLYENCAFPENFHSGKLSDIKIFYMQF